MTFDPARPRYTLPLAGQEYDLLGTMEVIENIEFRLQKPIGQIAADVPSHMANYELVQLVTAILGKCGHDLSLSDVKALLWEKVGLTGEANATLRLHLFAFLSICIAPPEAREAKAKDMGKLHGELTRISASPGESTKKTASADSAGNRRSSGKPQPGT